MSVRTLARGLSVRRCRGTQVMLPPPVKLATAAIRLQQVVPAAVAGQREPLGRRLVVAGVDGSEGRERVGGAWRLMLPRA